MIYNVELENPKFCNGCPGHNGKVKCLQGFSRHYLYAEEVEIKPEEKRASDESDSFMSVIFGKLETHTTKFLTFRPEGCLALEGIRVKNLMEDKHGKKMLKKRL